MENYLKDLSAQSLRKLLIKEVEKFIKCLDYGNLKELQLMKVNLKDIFNLLAERKAISMPENMAEKTSVRTMRKIVTPMK